jgi:hypothetical protein
MIDEIPVERNGMMSATDVTQSVPLPASEEWKCLAHTNILFGSCRGLFGVATMWSLQFQQFHPTADSALSGLWESGSGSHTIWIVFNLKQYSLEDPFTLPTAEVYNQPSNGATLFFCIRRDKTNNAGTAGTYNSTTLFAHSY